MIGTAAAGNDGGSYIVGIEPNANLDEVRGAADSVRKELDFGQIGTAVSGQFSEQALEALENNPNVRYIEENGTVTALDQQTPYGIETVKADETIADGETGDGVSVAILDTGIDAEHETLEENLGDGFATDGAACTTDCLDTCIEPWDDDNDHGTHVAGTAGAADNGVGVVGVAPDVTLHAVKVLGCDGSGTFDDIAEGISWSADQGHDVQNMSLGAPSGSSVVEDAVQYADEQGVIMIAAAGNDGCDGCVNFPAAYDEVIAVSATDENDDLANFSSTGPEVDFAAPGVDVLSAVPRDDYASLNGTSMAAPHVCGAVAVLLAAGVDPEDVIDELKSAADDIGLDDNEQGAGRLNVAEALDDEDEDDDDDDEDDDDDDEDDDDDDEDDDDDDDEDDDDDDDEDEEPESDPDIDSLDVSTRTTGPWSRATVEWSVSDDDGALDTVTSELLAGGDVLDTDESDVSGSSASDIHRHLRSRDEPDTVRFTVVDEAGNETSKTVDY